VIGVVARLARTRALLFLGCVCFFLLFFLFLFFFVMPSAQNHGIRGRGGRGEGSSILSTFRDYTRCLSRDSCPKHTISLFPSAGLSPPLPLQPQNIERTIVITTLRARRCRLSTSLSATLGPPFLPLCRYARRRTPLPIFRVWLLERAQLARWEKK
jgi:hypothetical protein